MTSELPSGIVTFLFTDIEGSTPFWEREPEQMRQALDQHHAVLQEAIGSHAGHTFKTVGDAFLAAFSLPSKAVEAAVAAQRELSRQSWPTSAPIRVRMGVHTGPAVVQGDDYATTHTLNRVTRIMSTAHGGQILLSTETVDLMQAAMTEGLTLRDMGNHRLKGLSQLEHLYQLVAPDLPAEFPPLASSVTSPNNLPVQLNSFVGRQKQIADIERLLADAPLVTLTGPGGTGKTRISLQIAAESLGSFKDGVWLIELAPLSDPKLVPHALATVLSVREQPGRSITDALTDYLRRKSILLVLDNCEHLIEDCAELAAHLLRSCPELKMIATSREALGVAGETIYRLPSLSLPDRSGTISFDDSSRYEAIELFLDRVQAVKSDFALTPQNFPAIAQICRRLDGIPLAIELAAARVKLLTVEQIAERLDDRFRLLTGGIRTALPRQQTLRALIDWSYDLLTDSERQALRQLSVFAGGCTFEAAEAVLGIEALDLLDQLVSRSMVAVDEESDQARYRLLETIRQYAAEKLFEAHETEQARQRHLAYFLSWAETLESKLYGPEMIPYFDQLEADKENLRSAMTWGMANQPLSALGLVVAIYFFWSRRISATECLDWVDEALAHTQAEGVDKDQLPDSLLLRAKALTAKAYLLIVAGENIRAWTVAQDSIDLARQTGDAGILTRALSIGALIGGSYGDVSATISWANEGIALSRANGYIFEMGVLSGSLMFIERNSEQTVQSILEPADLQAARLSGNPWVIALLSYHDAQWALTKHNWDDAYTRFEETAVLFRQMRDQPFYVSCQSELGHIHRYKGRYQQAADVYRKTIRMWLELGHQPAIAHQLESFAYIAVATGQYEHAARLFGAAETLRESIGASMMQAERKEYERALDEIRQNSDPALMDEALAVGKAMTMDQAIEYAEKMEVIADAVT